MYFAFIPTFAGCEQALIIHVLFNCVPRFSVGLMVKHRIPFLMGSNILRHILFYIVPRCYHKVELLYSVVLLKIELSNLNLNLKSKVLTS